MRNLLNALTDGVEAVVAEGNFAARKASGFAMMQEV
jgi:hypothetical protein